MDVDYRVQLTTAHKLTKNDAGEYEAKYFVTGFVEPDYSFYGHALYLITQNQVNCLIKTNGDNDIYVRKVQINPDDDYKVTKILSQWQKADKVKFVLSTNSCKTRAAKREMVLKNFKLPLVPQYHTEDLTDELLKLYPELYDEYGITKPENLENTVDQAVTENNENAENQEATTSEDLTAIPV